MNKQKLVSLLKKDIQAWNEWRQVNPHIAPDLSGEDLSNCNLQGGFFENVNLSRVNLSYSNLSNVVLTHSILIGADLSGVRCKEANLSYADLSNAYLYNTSFVRANMTETNLSFANVLQTRFLHTNLNSACVLQANISAATFKNSTLHHTTLRSSHIVNSNFQHATLQYTDFSYASIIDANFTGADLQFANFKHAYLSRALLKDAKTTSMIFGWTTFHHPYSLNTIDQETLEHQGPSDMTSTTVASLPDNSLTLLRGMGVSQTIQSYIQSTPSRNCFICYASEDEHIAQALISIMRNAGIKCWAFHVDELEDQNSVWSDEPVSVYDDLVVIFSKNSVKKVNYLLTQARQKEQKECLHSLYIFNLDQESHPIYDTHPHFFHFDKFSEDESVECKRFLNFYLGTRK